MYDAIRSFHIHVVDPAVPHTSAAYGELKTRDGSTEFDTDLCILKKRGDVMGIGIDSCDM